MPREYRCRAATDRALASPSPGWPVCAPTAARFRCDGPSPGKPRRGFRVSWQAWRGRWYGANVNRRTSAVGGVQVIPDAPWCAKFGRRLLRRDVGGAIRIPGAGDRRLEGERDGSRSRRLAVTVSGQSASNGAEPVTAERHRAGRACGVQPSPVHIMRMAAARSGTQIAARRVPKGNPWAVRPWSPARGSQGGSIGGLLGRLVRPAVAEWAPAYPSHPAPLRTRRTARAPKAPRQRDFTTSGYDLNGSAHRRGMAYREPGIHRIPPSRSSGSFPLGE